MQGAGDKVSAQQRPEREALVVHPQEQKGRPRTGVQVVGVDSGGSLCSMDILGLFFLIVSFS